MGELGRGGHTIWESWDGAVTQYGRVRTGRSHNMGELGRGGHTIWES